MYYLKIQNGTENNYKIINIKSKEIYKLQKKEEFIIKYETEQIELEILDPLFLQL